MRALSQYLFSIINQFWKIMSVMWTDGLIYRTNRGPNLTSHHVMWLAKKEKQYKAATCQYSTTHATLRLFYKKHQTQTNSFFSDKSPTFVKITSNIARQMEIIPPFKKGGTGTLILVFLGTVAQPGKKVKATKKISTNAFFHMSREPYSSHD